MPAPLPALARPGAPRVCSRRLALAALLAGGVLGASTRPALAQLSPAPADVAEPELEPWWSPLALALSLDAAVGIGTFVAHDKADDPYYASSLRVAPSWSFSEVLSLSAGLSLNYEWTYLVTPCHPASGPRPVGAPALDCSDTSDPNGRRATLSDLELELAHSRVVELEPVTVSAWTSLGLPVSRESRHTNNLFTLGLGGRVEVKLAPIAVGLGLSAHKFFPTAEAAVLDAVEAELPTAGGVPRARCASTRRSACLLLSGFVPSWRASTGVDVSAELPLLPGLSATVALEYSYSRRFGREPDAFSSPRVDADGVRVVDGVSSDDTTSGTIELGYTLDDSLSFAFGTNSTQPARTEDGRALRFPFYDLISPAQNHTTWYLSGTLSL